MEPVLALNEYKADEGQKNVRDDDKWEPAVSVSLWLALCPSHFLSIFLFRKILEKLHKIGINKIIIWRDKGMHNLASASWIKNHHTFISEYLRSDYKLSNPMWEERKTLHINFEESKYLYCLFYFYYQLPQLLIYSASAFINNALYSKLFM